LSEGFKFKEHIDELRHRLKTVAIVFVATILVVFLLPLNPSQLLSLSAVYYTTPVAVFLQSVIGSILPPGWEIIPFHVAAPLEILLMASFILSVAIDMPVITYEMYKFIDPALSPEERRMVYPVIAATTLLFLVGLAFGYFILAKFVFIAMAPFYSAIGVSPPYLIEALDFYTVVFLTIFFSAIAFTTPVFVYLLIRFRVVPASVFSKYRVWIWAGTYVVTALVTPDGGPILDVILFVPVIALLELGVFLGRRATGERGETPEPPRGIDCPSCGYHMDLPRLFCERCGKSIA
jgi:sec-independent protein translocase protein TatC